MRRIVLIALALAVLLALAAFGPFGGGGGGGYEVRAYFDNGDFVVSGEDVRIAGAKVGSVVDTGVSMPGETVNRDGSPDPGKAFVVMRIDDPGFQSFRRDASCTIRPQSLLGEKYIDCSPTRPRAPGSPEAPALKTIPSGQPGAGQRFLPLQNNGHIVDLDLVQNIQRLPYRERFRIILNELGAGLAARGPTLNAVIKRADPALRYTDEVFHILAGQNRELADLARNSDTVLAPLARERRHVSGFIANAGATAQATAERSKALEAGFHRFPSFLRNLRSTMVQLHNFSNQAQPVLAELGGAAPTLTRLTKQLAPFSSATERSLTSLGDAAAKSQRPLIQSDPVVVDFRDLARKAKSPATNLKRLLGSLQTTGGFQQLLSFLYRTAGSVNAFDKYGHFLRAELLVTSCVDYALAPLSGCGANFTSGGSGKRAAAVGAGSRDATRAPTTGGIGTGSATAKTTEAGPVGRGPGLRAAKRLLHFLVGTGKVHVGASDRRRIPGAGASQTGAQVGSPRGTRGSGATGAGP